MTKRRMGLADSLPLLTVRATLALAALAWTAFAAPAPPQAGPATQTLPQLLDDFAWPNAVGRDAGGYRAFSRLAGQRGPMGGGEGPHSVAIENGVARLFCREGGWSGLRFSLEGLMNDERSLDFDHAWPAPIKEEFQVRVRSWMARVKGQGRFRIELKDRQNKIVYQWQGLAVADEGFTNLSRTIPVGLGPLKFFNLAAESPSDLVFDELSFEIQASKVDLLRYGFLTSYAQLLHCYDPPSGQTRDRAHAQAGEFDSVPMLGGQALAAACAADLGFISRASAVQIATHSLEALRKAPPHPRGWLPHWLKHGQRLPGTEYSTVDTAIALLSALEAATALGLDSDGAALRQMVARLDFSAVTTPAHEISHGFGSDGALIRWTWKEWGGETALVMALRNYQNPTLPEAAWKHTPPHYRGVGFIIELGALLFPQFGAAGTGPDKWGVDWQAERRRHFEVQQRHRASPFGVALSTAEVIAAEGQTGYAAFGAGTPQDPPVDSLAGFGGPMWYTPHYQFMAASLHPEEAAGLFGQLRDAGLMPPLSGPAESVLLDEHGRLTRWHSVQFSLNAWFNVLGAYHAICAREGRRDAVYEAAQTDARMAAALARFLTP